VSIKLFGGGEFFQVEPVLMVKLQKWKGLALGRGVCRRQRTKGGVVELGRWGGCMIILVEQSSVLDM